MTKQTEKHIVVYEDTHKKAKLQAAQRYMTLRQYIDFLIELDKQVIAKG